MHDVLAVLLIVSPWIIYFTVDLIVYVYNTMLMLAGYYDWIDDELCPAMQSAMMDSDIAPRDDKSFDAFMELGHTGRIVNSGYQEQQI
jgi:hypothetical protein